MQSKQTPQYYRITGARACTHDGRVGDDNIKVEGIRVVSNECVSRMLIGLITPGEFDKCSIRVCVFFILSHVFV